MTEEAVKWPWCTLRRQGPATRTSGNSRVRFFDVRAGGARGRKLVGAAPARGVFGGPYGCFVLTSRWRGRAFFNSQSPRKASSLVKSLQSPDRQTNRPRGRFYPPKRKEKRKAAHVRDPPAAARANACVRALCARVSVCSACARVCGGRRGRRSARGTFGASP